MNTCNLPKENKLSISALFSLRRLQVFIDGPSYRYSIPSRTLYLNLSLIFSREITCIHWWTIIPLFYTFQNTLSQSQLIFFREITGIQNTCNLSRENKAEIEIKCSGRYRILVWWPVNEYLSWSPNSNRKQNIDENIYVEGRRTLALLILIISRHDRSHEMWMRVVRFYWLHICFHLYSVFY
jgi:hypothetical protein